MKFLLGLFDLVQLPFTGNYLGLASNVGIEEDSAIVDSILRAVGR